jgi:hypothetical protein
MPQTKLKLVMEFSIRSNNRDLKIRENEEEYVRKSILLNWFKLKNRNFLYKRPINA